MKKSLMSIMLVILMLMMVSLVGCNNLVEKEIIDTTTSVKVEEPMTKSTVDETTLFDDNNEFFFVLEQITRVHPGTAGCSLQIVGANVALLDICRSRMAFEPMVKGWFESKNKDSISDIKESFNFAYESIDELMRDDAKMLLEDAGIEVSGFPWDDAVFDTAKSILKIVIDY